MGTTKVTTEVLRAMKARHEKIVALTAYDHLVGRLLDIAGVDVVLVGDSLGTVVQGHDTTVSVTMQQMLYHCEMVSRSAARAFVVGDMPFMSFQVSDEEALRNAGLLMKEGHVEAVKLEGGRTVAGTVQRLTHAGIPVMGHLGLTPQSIHLFGTYRVRGTADEESARIIEDAKILQDAGAFAVVLEKVPSELARTISAALAIPTIGIGAGPHCDGQILVTMDMLGLFTRFRPRFVRRYAQLEDSVLQALRQFRSDVKDGEFPGVEESY